jgi:hypothetical protein
MYRYLFHHSLLSFVVYSLRLIVLPVAYTGFDWTACLGGHLSLACRICIMYMSLVASHGGCLLAINHITHDIGGWYVSDS